MQWLNQIFIQPTVLSTTVVLTRMQGKTKAEASTSCVPTVLLPGPSNLQFRDFPNQWWPSEDFSSTDLPPSPI